MTTTNKAQALIRWTAKYDTGLTIVDTQHQKLVDIINDLYSCFLHKDGEASYMAIVERMLDYTTYHFVTEEKLMRQYHYPDTGAHKADHDGFVNSALAFKKEMEHGKVTVSYTIINFLRKWLVEHMSIADKKMADYIMAHN